MRYYPHPFSVDESREWIKKWLAHEKQHGFSLWAIEDRETAEFLGNCGPAIQLVDGEQHVELGWSVTPRRVRQGIASEAAAAWRDQCLGPMGLDHVISLVRPENAPSRGVAERIGMAPWKETTFGSQGWRHIVYRVDAHATALGGQRSVSMSMMSAQSSPRSPGSTAVRREHHRHHMDRSPLLDRR
jgi:RimJ/RimL family protein N-acetyltransferase